MQGVPFSVAGCADLLALFRCVSCRYKFGTDTSKPVLMVSWLLAALISSDRPMSLHAMTYTGGCWACVLDGAARDVSQCATI